MRHSLFHSKIDNDLYQPQKSLPTYVQFIRHTDVPFDLCSCLAGILWTLEAPGQSIGFLSDVLTVRLAWRAGSRRDIWKLEEQVVLGQSDR